MSKLSNAFSAWLADPSDRPVLPITVSARARGVDFVIHTRRARLDGRLTDGELTVYAEWEGENWDLLLSLDVLPVRVAGGFICELCEELHREVFPTLESLWRDHLFGPLGEWINDKVARAEVLAFYQVNNKGMTWVKLYERADQAAGAAHIARL